MCFKGHCFDLYTLEFVKLLSPQHERVIIILDRLKYLYHVRRKENALKNLPALYLSRVECALGSYLMVISIISWSEI